VQLLCGARPSLLFHEAHEPEALSYPLLLVREAQIREVLGRQINLLAYLLRHSNEAPAHGRGVGKGHPQLSIIILGRY
jgi:hypothetical protein